MVRDRLRRSAAVLATVLAAVLAAVLATSALAGCGGEDNPISSRASDRPLTSSSSPAPSASASASGSASASASASASGSASPAPLASSPAIGSSPTTGVVVRGSGFTVLLPGEPEKSSESAEGKITFDIYRYENDVATYTVTRGYYPKIGTLPTLRDAIDSAAGQAGGKLATKHELKYKHHPAIEGVITGVDLDGKNVTVFVRYVVVNRVMYGLLYLDKGAGRDFDSAFKTFVESLTVSG